MVDLRFDVFPGVGTHRGNINFTVKVTDIADNGLILHPDHMVMGDDVVVAGGGNEDVGLVTGPVHCHHTVAFHGGLKCADRVDFNHPDLS